MRKNNYSAKKGLGAPRKKTAGRAYKFSHTPNSSKGLGDYYGTGIRAKLGKVRDDTMGMNQLTPGELKTAPKSLA